MRKTRKILAALLAMVMAMSVFCLTAFAGDKKTYESYVFFGDSITAAVGIEGYKAFLYAGQSAEGKRVPGSYPDILASKVGINNENENYYNESHSGWRTSELREAIDPDFVNVDGEVAKSTAAAMAGHDLEIDPANEEVKKRFREEIAKSDLITIDLGSNDLQLPIIMSLGTVLNPTASEDYKMGLIEQLLRKYGDANEVILQLADSVAKIHGIEFALETVLKGTLTGLHQFNTNYPAIIEKIQDINPTADIYVVGLYNPLTDTQISEELPLKIGKVIDPIILGMNVYLSQLNPARGHYTYVDAFNTEVLKTLTLSTIMGEDGNFGGFGQYVWYIHPSEDGHQYIADQIYKSIPDKPAVLNGIVKGEDGRWALYKNNKVVTSATGIYQNEKGWWRVKDGYVDFEANGIYQNALGWWKTTNGKVTFKETGIFQNENGKWYVRNSQVDFTKFGRVKYDGKTYTVMGGKVVA
jgi:GDSL-like Lipase/Acylhydrolase.